MHQVTLTYRPVPFLPFRKTLRRGHPERWEELSQEQFIAVSDYLQRPLNSRAHRTLLTNRLLSLKEPFNGFPEEILQMAGFIRDYHEKPFSCVLIREIRAGGQTFYGPGNEFRTLGIGEFAFADTFFIKLMEKNNPDSLHRLISVLYRPLRTSFNPDDPSFDGDPREPFNPFRSGQRAKLMAGLDARLKRAILFNYRVIRRWIIGQYTWVFPQTDDPDNENRSVSTWRDFIRELVAGDYVNQEKILRTPVHTVLSDLDARIRKQQTKKR